MSGGHGSHGGSSHDEPNLEEKLNDAIKKSTRLQIQHEIETEVRDTIRDRARQAYLGPITVNGRVNHGLLHKDKKKRHESVKNYIKEAVKAHGEHRGYVSDHVKHLQGLVDKIDFDNYQIDPALQDAFYNAVGIDVFQLYRTSESLAKEKKGITKKVHDQLYKEVDEAWNDSKAAVINHPISEAVHTEGMTDFIYKKTGAKKPKKGEDIHDPNKLAGFVFDHMKTPSGREEYKKIVDEVYSSLGGGKAHGGGHGHH